MTDIDAAAGVTSSRAGGGSLKLVLIIVVAMFVMLIGTGAAWWFLLGGKAAMGGKTHVEQPLPFFLAMKPFVISVGSNAGSARFVQMGPTLQLPGTPASEMVNAVLPQVQDIIRQTVLSFRSDELQSAAGINKLRAALLAKINEMLVQVLGPDRIEKANGSGNKPDAPLVQNIYFPTLVVE